MPAGDAEIATAFNEPVLSCQGSSLLSSLLGRQLMLSSMLGRQLMLPSMLGCQLMLPSMLGCQLML